MMEAARTSETLVNSTRLHGATTQKTAIFILTAVRTSNPKYKNHITIPYKAFLNTSGFFQVFNIAAPDYAADIQTIF
jgi:hypothetical protein